MEFITGPDGYKRMKGSLTKDYKIDNHWFRVHYTQPYSHSVGFKGTELWIQSNGSREEDREELVHGQVKWDGCVDMDMGRGQSYHLHSCGRTLLVALGTLMGRIYDQCADIMKHGGVLLDGGIGQKPVVDNEI